MAVRIGVDLGGTKIEAIALDNGGSEMLRRRIPTPQGDYEGTLRAVASLVGELETELGDKGRIGIGTPGAISPATGLMKNANSVWLNGRPLARDLARLLKRPLRFANDANCFALSEASDGAAEDARVVFGVIVGTGTGAGIVIDKQVLTGKNAIAGEWGHNPLPWPQETEWPGPRCYCGHTACTELFLSGPGLSRDHQETTHTRLSAAEIAHHAGQGDPAAEATLMRYEEQMGRALASVLNILDPDVVVLGGGMSNLGRLYVNVPRLWAKYAFSDRVDTPLRPPRHGDSSGVRGAARLWPPDSLSRRSGGPASRRRGSREGPRPRGLPRSRRPAGSRSAQ